MLPTDKLHTLHRTLLSGFSQDEFGSLLRTRLGVRLELLAPPGDMKTQVYEVLQTAERAGWTHDLVQAAYETKPQNEALAALYEDLGLASKFSVQHAGVAMTSTPSPPAAVGFERELSIRRFDMVDWGVARERLAAIEARVCRVEVGGGSMGTGFLVGPDAVLTCYHVVREVVEGRKLPSTIRCRFDYRVLANGVIEGGTAIGLALEDWLVDFSPYSPGEADNKSDAQLPTADELDYALLRLTRPVGREPLDPSAKSGPPRGWIRMPDPAPELSPKMPLMLFSYALGGPLKVTMDTEAVIGLNENKTRVRYAMNTEAGSGGAPCFDLNWNLVAVHHYRDPEFSAPRFRQGIPIVAIRDRLRRVGKADALGGEPPGRDQPSARAGASDSRPPEPGPVLDADDSQKGRWGGSPERGGRRLSVELTEVSQGVFYFDAIVTSTDGSPLEGPVIFHLHDSYSKSVIWIKKIRADNSAVLEQVSSYGVFTIGVQVKDARGDWTSLELNLVDLHDLPGRFKSR